MVKMKNLKMIFWMAAIMILMMACKNKSSSLLGTWRLKDLKYTQEVPQGMQATIDKSVEKLRNSLTLTYNADGTYESKMEKQVLRGNWKLNWNSSVVSVVTDQG